MSDFMDSEAEESAGEVDEQKLSDHVSEEEDEEVEEADPGLFSDLINDEPEEGEGTDDDEMPRKKRRRRGSEDELDDDDLALIQENTGLKIKKKKHTRVKLLESDESGDDEDAPVEKEKDEIAHELFEGDDQTGFQEEPEIPLRNNTYAALEDLEESEGDDDDDFGFIVDEDGQPLRRKAKRKVGKGYVSSALQEAQDIFGLEFDLNDLEQYDDEEDGGDDYEDDDEETQTRRRRKKTTRKSIYEIYEPSELEKSHLTDRDAEIRIADIPERFQLRPIPVVYSDDNDLEDEAEWIYKQAFMQVPISQLFVQTANEFERRHQQFVPKPVSCMPKIKAALSFMKKELFEVPFISTYRKEYVEPELNINDLWKVYNWDAKWTQFIQRKRTMKKLFEGMQFYQFELAKKDEGNELRPDFRVLETEDVERLDNAQTIDDLMDVYGQFQLYYGNDIAAMEEWRESSPPAKTLSKPTNDNTAKDDDDKTNKEDDDDNIDAETGEVKITTPVDDTENTVNIETDVVEKPKAPPARKLPKRRDVYSICSHGGLGLLASKFGLDATKFGENLRDNYQRHETEQHTQEPTEAAEEFVCSSFPTTDAVLAGARHMVAVQLAKEPLVRSCVRQIFYERAKLSLTPTAKGKKEIDDFHSYASFKYIKNKPVRDLQGEQFLKMHQAEIDGHVKIKISIGSETENGPDPYFDEIKQLYYRDEFSNLVQEWNTQREQALSKAIKQILYSAFENEMKKKLLIESKQFVVDRCVDTLRSLVSIAPYQAEQSDDQADWEEASGGRGCRVLACAFLPDQNTAAFAVMLDGDGQVIDFLRLKNLLKRRNGYRAKDKEDKMLDIEAIKHFISKHHPQVIAIGSDCRDAQSVVEDFRFCVTELEQEQQLTPIYVEMVDVEVAKIFENSPRSEIEFREYPSLLRRAISIGRRIQDPLLEYAGLCDNEDELLCLRLHSLQDSVGQEELKLALETELISQVNNVGVDINRAVDFIHVACALQFVCGLGTRKGGNLLKVLKQSSLRLENRSQLVTVCGMGPQVFLNCAGFIKIDTSSIGENMEVLDGTRIHPETYDWARKMAVDALEYDEGMEESNPSAAVEEIIDQPDRLKDLDLDAFADELARQGYGNKQVTLYDIRDELIHRFKDHRPVFRTLSIEDRFRMLSTETPDSMYIGRLITCVVTGFAYRKPTREALDQANPVRNDDTNTWQCPFCLKGDFPDLSEVWTHFDNGSCPGQAVGVKTRLDTGISGFITTKNISDKEVFRPEERVQVGMTLHCRVLKVNFERIQVDLTCRSSDLADKDGKFSPPKDLYYHYEAADKEKKHQADLKTAKDKRTSYLKRVIAHPSFKNVTFKDAEKLLDTMEQGECIIRPSSKGNDHLTITWKVDKGIFSHIDVREEGKENDFSLGKSLIINNEEYEDLDEIIARHIHPLTSNARDILSHRYYIEADGGSKQKLEEILTTEKRKHPSKIPYMFSSSKSYPGKFMLGYMPRNKPRIEYITITADGYRYRGRVHGSLNSLLKWFKEHFRDPIPGITPRQRLTTPHAMIESNTPFTPSATPGSLMPGGGTPMARIPEGIPSQVINAAMAAVHGTPTMQHPTPQQGGAQQFPGQWNPYAVQPAAGIAPSFPATQDQQQQQQQYNAYNTYQQQGYAQYSR